MNKPGPENIKKAAQWAVYAEEDMRYAEHGMKLVPDTPYRLVAYHAQQCAEKYLKAFLILNGIDFPYTHNISALLELCADVADWTDTLSDAEELTQYAVTVRYPGEDEAVERDEAARAIHIAGQVKAIVGTALSGSGMVTE